ISSRGQVSLAANPQRSPRLRRPAGLVLDGASHLLVTDLGSGELYRLRLADGITTQVAGGQGDSLAWDQLGRLYLSNPRDGRIFGATQHGVIHVFPNDQKATQTKVFLDIHKQVHYNDEENEEGFLGLAFHPRFEDNGEFFVFYTTSKARHTNVLSRFRVRRDDA